MDAVIGRRHSRQLLSRGYRRGRKKSLREGFEVCEHENNIEAERSKLVE
jgi:hypothetical protein